MTTFVLIPDAWYWHLVEAELTRRGHDVVNVDLPADDEKAGLREYADVVDAAGSGPTRSWSRCPWVGSPPRWWPRGGRCPRSSSSTR
ncbi:hypothetical protein ACFQZ4_07050 [Catellatospora coxensis]